MKGDFSRDSFNPEKNYSSVKMQQGRVLLDSDWNEQVDIQNHHIQTQTLDFIGPEGAPHGNAGFGIKNITNSNNTIDFEINKGRFYVNGILYELMKNITYKAQLDYPEEEISFSDGEYLIYLDVWQREVSMLEDPCIQENALEGVDTTLRVKNVAQVKIAELAGKTAEEKINALREKQELELRGRLAASISAPHFENLLYRIEVVGYDSGNNTLTYKWSRNNANNCFKINSITEDSENNQLKWVIEGNAELLNQQIEEHDILEAVTETNLRDHTSGNLFKIVKIDDDQIITSNPASVPSVGSIKHIRIWNGENSCQINDDQATQEIQLDPGLKITFSLPLDSTDATFHPGDYWTFATRNGNIKNDMGIPQPCKGILHSYAMLSTFKISNNSIDGDPIDKRIKFSSKANQIFTYHEEAPKSVIHVDDQGNLKILLPKYNGPDIEWYKCTLEINDDFIGIKKKEKFK